MAGPAVVPVVVPDGLRAERGGTDRDQDPILRVSAARATARAIAGAAW
ncbi:MAG TPA: hypothetical protein VG268_16840 [Streptosporangiaceae bacterium]|nr:hypothetical protein [Streptosporangiaceae bacterium]